jgi:hypothetical protein
MDRPTTSRFGKAATLAVLATAWCLPADAQRYEVYETYPGTGMRDLHKPATVYEWKGDSRLEVYETYPGMGMRDLHKPATVYERNRNGDIEVYETYPGMDMRDLHKPSVVIRESDW